MNSTTEAPRYQAYLLRLWPIEEGDSVVWRASLEDPRTGERHGFADLNSLVAFLNDVCRASDHGDSLA